MRATEIVTTPQRADTGTGDARPNAGTRDARVRLARMVTTLFQHWQLSTVEQSALLGMSTSHRATLARYRRGEPLADSRDLLDRVGHLLGIHKSLRILFPHDPDLAYRWMSTRNRAFDNLTPVEVVKEWGFAGLLMVRAYLDRARGQ